MKVLLIDDDPVARRYVKYGLCKRGFEVEAAAKAETGYRRAVDREFDVLVLDVVLPDADGCQLLSRIRKAGCETPALFLSRLGEVDDRLRGLSAGADDYLPKPFSLAELAARVRAISRRRGPAGQELHVGDLRLDPVARRVERAGRTIALPAKQFNLLELLMRNAGRVVLRQTIAEALWSAPPRSNVLNVLVNSLRKAVDEGCEEQLIHTRPGLGYVIEVRQEAAATPPARKPATLVVDDSDTSRRFARFVLESAGCTVRLAGTGAQALRLARHHSFDLVLIDCVMRGLSGFEIAAALRAPDAPIGQGMLVALTASSAREIRATPGGEVFDAVVEKPLDAAKLDPLLQRGRSGTAPRHGSTRWLTTDRVEKIRNELGAAYLNEILETFASELRKLCGAISRGLCRGQLETVARRMHTLQGDASLVGAAALSDAASAIEGAARSGNRERTAARLARLRPVLEATLDALQRETRASG